MAAKKALSFIGFFVAISSGVLPSFQSQAQIPEAASAAALGTVGKLLVGDVLDQVQKMILNCASIANNSVNLDFGNAYIALQAGTQGVFNSLDGERKTIVNNLDDERKNALLDVYVMATDLTQNQIPAAQAKLKVDTLTMLNHVALLGKKTPFMIARIDPTVVAEKASGDYQITVTGIGIGNQEGDQLPTAVTIDPPNGNSLEIKTSNTTDGIVFDIPRSAIEPYFSNSSFYKLPIKIDSKVSQTCGFLHLAKCDQPYSFDYNMTLFPREAVTGVIKQIRTTLGTDPSTRTAKYVEADTGNGDNGGGGMHLPWSTNVVTPDPGFLFTKIDYASCENGWAKPGNPCAFLSIADGALIPKNGGAAALVNGENWSWPLRIHFVFWEERQITISIPISPIPVSFAPGESKTITVTGDAASALIELTTVTGKQTIVPLIPSGGNVTDPLSCTNPTSIGGNQIQYICKAKDVGYY